jgi:hypothetical protein
MTTQAPDQGRTDARPSATRVAVYLLFLVAYYAVSAIVYAGRLGDYVRDLDRHFQFFGRLR